MSFYNKKPRDGEKRGMTIEVHNNDVDRAMRKLKNLIQKEGLLKDVKKKEYYEKPSEIKRRKKKEAVKRQRKIDKMQEDFFS